MITVQPLGHAPAVSVTSVKPPDQNQGGETDPRCYNTEGFT